MILRITQTKWAIPETNESHPISQAMILTKRGRARTSMDAVYESPNHGRWKEAQNLDFPGREAFVYGQLTGMSPSLGNFLTGEHRPFPKEA